MRLKLQQCCPGLAANVLRAKGHARQRIGLQAQGNSVDTDELASDIYSTITR